MGRPTSPQHVHAPARAWTAKIWINPLHNSSTVDVSARSPSSNESSTDSIHSIESSVSSSSSDDAPLITRRSIRPGDRNSAAPPPNISIPSPRAPRRHVRATRARLDPTNPLRDGVRRRRPPPPPGAPRPAPQNPVRSGGVGQRSICGDRIAQERNIASGRIFPGCQDTETAIVMGKRSHLVLTDGDDDAHLSEGTSTRTRK